MKKDVIVENRESKNINLARKYCISRGYNQEQAQRVIDGIRHDIPNSRLAGCKFLAGVARMYLDRQLTDANVIMNLNKTLKYVAGNTHVNEYDSNLNNLSAEAIISKFSGVMVDDLAKEKEQSANRTYVQNNQYNIVKIPDFETASQYSDYVTWCVTQDERAYNSYTNNGLGVFYFCLKNGFENVPDTPGENAPLDEYGLSMIAVSVNEDGSPNTITCRWNHNEGGNDNIMTPQQLEQVIGRGFYQTFLPYSEEEMAERQRGLITMALDEFRERYCAWNSIEPEDVDGETLIPLFDNDSYDNEGDEDDYENQAMMYNDGLKYFAYKYEGEDMNTPKYIIVSNEGELLIEDLFDNVEYSNSVVYITKGQKTTFMLAVYDTPHSVTDKWYAKAFPSRSPLYLIVMNEQKLFNIVYKINGKEVLEEWVKSCEVYNPNGDNGFNYAIILWQDGFNIVTLTEGFHNKPLFSQGKFEISICAGYFMKVIDRPNREGDRKPFEIYAFDLEKFPYPVYSCDGIYGGYYRVTCETGYVFFDTDTSNGFKIRNTVSFNDINNSMNTRIPVRRVMENKNKRVVVLTEDMGREIKDLLTMTQFKFKANIKKFLASLLEDPTGAEPGMIFTKNGLDKNKLIKALVDNKVITKKMTIDDHDADGNPHTARMIVKYTVPKERFNERLDALYDILFPNVEGKIHEDITRDDLEIMKNSPLTIGVINQTNPNSLNGMIADMAAEEYNKKAKNKKELDEEGGAGGGAASCSGVDGNGFGSGEFVQPLFGGISVRKKKKDKKSVGGNPYTLNESQESKSIDKDGVLCDYETKEPIQQPGLNETVYRILKRIISEAVTGEDGRKSSAVYAYAKNSNGEWCILAAKRNKKWDDEGGKMNPPMGHRHKYESPEDGAVRECEEESGIRFNKKDLVLASKEDWGTNFKLYLPGKTSDYKPGEGDEENTKFRWIPVSQIDNYEWAWSCGTFAKRFKPKK